MNPLKNHPGPTLAWPTPARQADPAPAIAATLDALRGARLQEAGLPTQPRMLISGALRLDAPAHGGDRAVLLALPGDLIGLEALQGQPAGVDARAIVASVLAPLPAMGPAAWQDLLLRSLVQQQARRQELALLRSGAVAERVRRLLLLLSQQSRGGAGLSPWKAQTASCEQPTLADMAALTDTTEETVSRVISAMRRQGDLLRDHGRRVRLSDRLLRSEALPSSDAVYRPGLRREARAAV